MSNTEKVVQAGPPWLMLFTLVLLVLKLSGTVAMDWVWVFSPLWIPLLTAVGILAVVSIFLFFGWLFFRRQ